MNKLRAAWDNRPILVADGALGTMLQAAGLPEGMCPEVVCLEKPELLREIAGKYVAAGADIVQTNTFGASPLKLAEYGLEDKTEEINRTAAAVVKGELPSSVLLSGSCGPTGKLLFPYGTFDPEDVFQGFTRQIAGLVDGGVDMICVETMMDLREAVLAVRAARQYGLPVVATMTYSSSPNGYHTMMGNPVNECVTTLEQEGVTAVGANCGYGIEQMVDVVQEITAVSTVPVIIQSNAGTPEIQDGSVLFPETPEKFGSYVTALLERGARIVGGCCGTTPDHIAEVRVAVDQYLDRQPL